ncbi:MAG TPA: MFS transporter [Verrucomicrobiae bacterium]|nr:MFS transporter [Verrucomicrobiae bacterium]
MTATAKSPIKHLRWYIVILLCLASQLNYLDRQTFSVLAVTLQKEFSLTDIDYSFITTIFLWTYAIAYLFSGYIVDRLGTRRSFITFVSGWSAANMLHAFVKNFVGLALCRGLLAVMEPANFPAGLKAVSEWFPMRERALAVGIFNSGTAFGNALAVPVTAFITLRYGWQSAFVLTGILGFIWVIAWALIYRSPGEHLRLGKEELALIEAEQTEEEITDTKKISILRILRMREVWGCMLARLLTDPVSYFLFFWIPKYLENERGFDLKQVGMLAWIPFVALAVGNVYGGAMPRWLVSRGWTVNRARKTNMFFVSCGMVIVCYLVTKVPTSSMAVAILALVMFGHAAWANMTLPAEVFPKNVVGTVTGLGGFLGGISGGVAQLIIGGVVMKYGYGPIFAVCSVMYLVAFAAVHFLIGELGIIRKIPLHPTRSVRA